MNLSDVIKEFEESNPIIYDEKVNFLKSEFQEKLENEILKVQSSELGCLCSEHVVRTPKLYEDRNFNQFKPKDVIGKKLSVELSYNNFHFADNIRINPNDIELIRVIFPNGKEEIHGTEISHRQYNDGYCTIDMEDLCIELDYNGIKFYRGILSMQDQCEIFVEKIKENNMQ